VRALIKTAFSLGDFKCQSPCCLPRSKCSDGFLYRAIQIVDQHGLVVSLPMVHGFALM
jgi:hypothetical protein